MYSLIIEDADREANFYRAAMSFAGGTGQLTTAWRGDEKWTALRFESGAALRLDHQRVSGRLTGTDNDTSFAAVPGAARLVSHYTPMFTELLVDGRRRFATADDVALHRLLLEA